MTSLPSIWVCCVLATLAGAEAGCHDPCDPSLILEQCAAQCPNGGGYDPICDDFTVKQTGGWYCQPCRTAPDLAATPPDMRPGQEDIGALQKPADAGSDAGICQNADLKCEQDAAPGN